MPDTTDTDQPTAPPRLSRRGLIKHATIAGTTGVVAGLALNAGLATAASAAAPERGRTPATSGTEEPFMVRVVDARTGELDIFHGHRHHKVRDLRLVNELLRAAR